MDLKSNSVIFDITIKCADELTGINSKNPCTKDRINTSK